MPRGRGNDRGFRPGPQRGRGRGRGGRGRGSQARGGFQPSNNARHGEGTLVFEGDVEDFNLDHMMLPSSRITPIQRGPSHRGTSSPAPIGRGRGGFQTPRGLQNGRGGIHRGRGLRGIGFSPELSRSRISLSTLERDRPLLQPVVFVRGEHQKTLFQEVEEIMHAHGEGGLEDHAPSADIVERIFHHEEPAEDVSPNQGSNSSESEDNEEAEVAVGVLIPPEEPTPTFFVDTTPNPVVSASQVTEVAIDRVEAEPLGEAGDDEEIIVYVAPHPRISRCDVTVTPPVTVQDLSTNPPGTRTPPPLVSSPSLPAVRTTVDATPISYISLADPDEVLSKQVNARRRMGLKPTPRSRKMAKKERAAARRRDERRSMFSFGLSMEERNALQQGSTIRADPRRVERRVGDSDIEWGTDDDAGLEEVRSGIGDMDLDGEIGDMSVLARFAQGVEGLAGKEAVTIANLEDAAKMREESEDSSGHGSSEDNEDDFDAEERREIGEQTNMDSTDSSDEETPRRSFQGRLNRLREKAKGKAVFDVESSDGEEDTDVEGVFEPGFSSADRDERFLEGINDLLDMNEDLVHGGDRKARNRLFKAIQCGDYEDDYEAFVPSNMRRKDRHIPPQLRDQWERDRAKKAERRRNRALARMEAAADSPATRRSTKRKQKILGGAKVDGSTFHVDRVYDMAVLEQMIRSFLSNLELKSFVLPPKSKDFRRRAHLLAEAFNLKSKSMGKGEGRFTTLIRTTRSGVGINERKISRLVNGNSGEGFHTPAKAGKVFTVRHRDGDEVGKAAPRLSDSNIGFKLLQQMGWEEGSRIGVTGGLADPLTAIMKTTKLGLGATR